MRIFAHFRLSVLSAAMVLPMLLPATVLAQTHASALHVPVIEGFNVDEVSKLAPGTELNFELFGTPGALASLQVAGAQRPLVLAEVSPGQYEGTYTISSRDKILARSPVTANLRLGNQVVSLVLNESLQKNVGFHGVKMAPGPQPVIQQVRVEPVSDLKGGNDLRFSVLGTPGGQAELTIQGVKGKVLLPEVASGEYTSTYTIRNRDHITRGSKVTAQLRLGERTTSAVLSQALQSADAPARPSTHRVCKDCGTVQAINLVEVKGEGSYLGTIGGGVVGALLGSQVGGGNGRTAAQIAGALGGAYAGRAIEGKSRTTQHYEVVVLLQSGTKQTLTYATQPSVNVGDAVRVTDGVLTKTP